MVGSGAAPACDDAGQVTDLGDPGRRALIDRLALSGHLADTDLDAIVATVVEACRVPIAAINIVIPDLQTYPSERGLGRPCGSVPDALSFCAEVVRAGRRVTVADAQAHMTYSHHPLVKSGAIRAYAGEPLRFQGQVVGALSMSDDSPRAFRPNELEVLRCQARLVGAILQLRVLGEQADATAHEDEHRGRPPAAEGGPAMVGTSPDSVQLVLEQRIRQLHDQGVSTPAIAQQLNREGLRTARGLRFYHHSVDEVIATRRGADPPSGELHDGRGARSRDRH